MNKCPVCGGEKSNKICSRYNISPYQNKLFLTREEAIAVNKVNLEISICEQCGFVFNSAFDPSLCLYDENYNNDQNESGIFNKYVMESIDYIRSDYIKNSELILEIGCGKYGTYLKKLAPYLKETCRAIGFDPAYTEEKVLFEGKLRFFPILYDFNHIFESDIDFLICRHVIEHIYKPVELIYNIRKLVNKNGGMKAFVETPDVNWILENEVWFDFCYEHCSYFSPTSLQYVLQYSGLQLNDIKSVFNSQYLWAIIGGLKDQFVHEKQKKELDSVLDRAKRYSINEPIKLEKYYEMLRQLKKTGEIAIWGAGAKGNMFLNVLDKGSECVSMVIDINPAKANKYVAGTGHKVILPRELKKENIKNILLMNGNYYTEVINEIKDHKIEGINIINMDSIL